VATAVVGEVWIENNSNTPAVCRKVLTDWKDHQGRIEVYGDATGGARATSATMGSDWDIAKRDLRHGQSEHGVQGFGGRVAFYVKTANPTERARVNAMNTRCKASDGTIRLVADGKHAAHVVRDLEGVRLLAGGSGEIDKKVDLRLTHISDALGYYVDYRFPVVKHTATSSTVHM
jgi:hypothetical protein